MVREEAERSQQGQDPEVWGNVIQGSTSLVKMEHLGHDRGQKKRT